MVVGSSKQLTEKASKQVSEEKNAENGSLSAWKPHNLLTKMATNQMSEKKKAEKLHVVLGNHATCSPKKRPPNK